MVCRPDQSDNAPDDRTQRGLSRLQRNILALIADKYRLDYAEILEVHFHFPHAPRARGGLYHAYRQRVGEKRYAKAMSSVSRACQRLEGRGLIAINRGTPVLIQLTPEGVGWVKANVPTQNVKTIEEFQEERAKLWAKVKAQLGNASGRDRVEDACRAYSRLSADERERFFLRIKEDI
jgi:DNA-binding MarR family transcriptional regulator